MQPPFRLLELVGASQTGTSPDCGPPVTSRATWHFKILLSGCVVLPPPVNLGVAPPGLFLGTPFVAVPWERHKFVPCSSPCRKDFHLTEGGGALVIVGPPILGCLQPQRWVVFYPSI
jgi:hypothetical protein